jgi:hypothetical protein
MMQTTVRCSAIAAIIPAWLLSFAIVISAVHYNVAQAKEHPKRTRTSVGVACGKELQKQCSSVPVHANNMLECLQNDQQKLSARCAGLANNVVRTCDRDAVQRCDSVVAGKGNILGCLTASKRSVSAQCNAALDAVFLR